MEELAPMLYIAFNGPLLLLGGLVLLVAVKTWRDLPPVVLLLAVLGVIYIGGTSLLPSQPRYMAVILPWAGLVAADVLRRGLRVSFAA
jgi:hypothetical protein